jgi:8-oxo-dGTP pyrophosphatase MutT (NUDIX family)
MIVGLSRKNLDGVEATSLAKKPGKLTPKDAAALVLIDDSGPVPRVLLGKRRADLKFMPGQFVFPGGRRETSDARVPVASHLSENDSRLIAAGCGPRGTASRAKALAVAALREFYEETGFVIGKASANTPDWPDFAANGLAPDIGAMGYLARAITPPGRTRRFDTRFFMAKYSAVALEVPPPDAEFSEIRWATFAETIHLDLPGITRTILAEVDKRLKGDPHLTGTHAIPEFRLRGKTFVREERV